MEQSVDLRKTVEQVAAEGEGGEGEVQGVNPGGASEGGEKPEPPGEDAVQKLTAALEQARAAAAEGHNLYLRKAAEFENFRRRRDREFEEMIRSANEGLISRTLPVLENFERALNHRDASENFDAYRKGVEMIVQQFRDALKREGLEAVEAVGKPFDPNLHEALMQAPSDAHEAGLVCEEIERGYRLKDRVIRHAKVIVSLGPAEKKSEAQNS